MTVRPGESGTPDAAAAGPVGRRARIAVIGGGIAGLAAAHRLVELASGVPSGLEVTLYEAASRPGGSIATEHRDGYVIEVGPDAFLTEKPWAVALCERLGLADRLIGTRAGHRRTYVLHGGRLRLLPEGFALVAPTRFGSVWRSDLFTWRGKARMALDLVLPRGPNRDDESLGAFVTRRFGREVLERVAEPLVAGIYTADAATLSLRATMPRFLDLEQRHRSLILALRRGRSAGPGVGPQAGPGGSSGPRWGLFAAPDAGMGLLVRALAARLPAGALRLGARVRGIVPGGGAPARYRVVVDGGPAVPADGVVVAARAPEAAALVDGLDPGLADLLRGISYASSAVVALGYERRQIAHPLDAFGFVVPRAERVPLLACTFSSVKFAGRAPEERVLLRAFAGGALRQDDLARDDDALAAMTETALRPLLGISGRPHLTCVHRHPEAMPQYLLGHGARVARIEARTRDHTGFAVAGGAYHGVGIPDCIHSGEHAAERVLAAVIPERAHR